jgi:hypothetical protein
MKKLLPLSFIFVLAAACAVGLYPDRRGRDRDVVVAAPEFYGTVTYIDAGAHRIDLDYIEGGNHVTRNVYYDEGATRWNGVRYNEIKNGDRITVRGRQEKGQWRADEVRRHE